MRYSFLLALMAQFGLISCAQKGYYYETGSFSPKAIDQCARPETANGYIRALNSKVGARGGPSSQILSIENLAASETQNGWQCRGTLVLAQGREVGTISNRAGDVTWLSDREKVEQERQAKENITRVEKEAREAAEKNRNAKTPIEEKAVLYRSAGEDLALIEKMTRLVREFNYRCDSVSSARPMLTSQGYVLGCNNFSYTYNIRDKGGHWVVTID